MKSADDPIPAREYSALARAAGAETFGRGPALIRLQNRAAPGAQIAEAAVAAAALNDDSADIPNYCPVELAGHVDDLETVRVFKVILPTLDAVGKFAVSAAGIVEDAVGRIYLAGVCLCTVKTASGDKYADIETAGDTFLTGDPSTGAAEILYEDGGASSTAHLALIRFPRATNESGIRTARAATTVGTTLNDERTVDGVALVDGDICLVKHQPTTSQNGLYRVVDAADWVKLTAPDAVIVTAGTVNGRLAFVPGAANSWVALYGVLAP